MSKKNVMLAIYLVLLFPIYYYAHVLGKEGAKTLHVTLYSLFVFLSAVTWGEFVDTPKTKKD